MAPLSNEPDAIRVVLNMARRKVFYGLVREIMGYMRSQLDLEDAEDSDPPPYSATEVVAAAHNGASPSAARGDGDERGSDERPAPRAHSPSLVRLRKAALLHFDSWRAETLSKLKEVVAKADDQKALDARRKRAAGLSAGGGGQDDPLIVFDTPPVASTSDPQPSEDETRKRRELAAFQHLYHPIPTRLTTIPLRDREEVLSATLLLLLSAGRYSAHSRTLVCYLASALGIAPSTVDAEEKAIATTMASTAQAAAAAGAGMSADAEAQKRRDEGRAGRLWKVGLASVAGAALVGVTGGLAAPVVAAAVGGLMGTVGLGGLAGFLGLFWMNGALVGALFGAFGAKMTGEMADRYAKEVDDFRFLPLGAEYGTSWRRDGGDDSPAARRLRVTIGINGWLEAEDDVARPWRVLGDATEAFALRYEMASLLGLGRAMRALAGSAAWGLVRAEILKRTVLATLQGALWPVMLLSSASSLDNPFSLARNRSEKAGRVLADALVNRVQGERPVTLVGYSLGARVVYACLRALAERRAFGLVDTVVLIGAPVPSDAGHWRALRSVVAGRLFNVHSGNDYVLGFLYRGTSLQLGVAGLQAVGAGIEGVEDVDLSEQVHGHLRYPGLIAQILHRCGFADVKGGDVAIETEAPLRDSEIQLRDQDYAELGRLIDLGDDEEEGPRPLLPARRTARELANEKFDPAVKNVEEQKSDARTRDMKLMGGGGGNTSALKPKTGGTTPESSRSASDFTTRGQADSRRDGEQPVMAVHDAPHGRVAQQLNGDDLNYANNDSDEAEYGEGSITMLDDSDLSDGELTMVEPLSIEDEPPSNHAAHQR
ncbi:DUF726-domain-containing protein [Xylaria palmicola]|nr:DUF726-domain-containing protein [Xylaria palmicola]